MRRLPRPLRWISYAVLGLAALAAAIYVAHLRADLPLETLKARWTDDTSRFVDVDGMSVHYRDEGIGAPIVLLHGTSSSLHTWDGWTFGLSADARVVRLDLPAFGLTGPNPSGDYSTAAYLAFLEHFLARVGLRRFALAGNSFGGLLAWQYAVAHPDQVRALILVDSAGYPAHSTAAPIAFRLARWPVLAALLRHLDPRPLVEDGVERSYGDPMRIRAETVERYNQLALRPGNRAAFVDQLRTERSDQTALLRGLRTPTLVLWGGRDRLIPVATGKLFVWDIPDSRLIVYDDLGHVPMEEDAARTVADAERFLAEHAPK